MMQSNGPDHKPTDQLNCTQNKLDFRVEKGTEVPPELDLRMKKLFSELREKDRLESERKRKQMRLLKCMAAAGLAMFILTTVIAGPRQVGVFSSQLFNTFYKTYEDRTELWWSRNKVEKAVDEFPTLISHELTYLPDGFGLKSVETNSMTEFYEYSNDAGNHLIYRLSFTAATGTMIDTEETELLNTVVNGTQYFYYSNKGYQSVIWEKDGLLFYLDSDIPMDELFEVALNITPVKERNKSK